MSGPSDTIFLLGKFSVRMECLGFSGGTSVLRLLNFDDGAQVGGEGRDKAVYKVGAPSL